MDANEKIPTAIELTITGKLTRADTGEPLRGVPVELHVSTVCRVCGRALSVPESVKRGIGPTCLKRVNQAVKDYKETEEAEV